MTNDKSRQTSFRYPTEQHQGGGRGKEGDGHGNRDFSAFRCQNWVPERTLARVFRPSFARIFSRIRPPSARCSLDVRPNPTPGDPLERRGPPREQMCTKCQPRTPRRMPNGDERQSGTKRSNTWAVVAGREGHGPSTPRLSTFRGPNWVPEGSLAVASRRSCASIFF